MARAEEVKSELATGKPATYTIQSVRERTLPDSQPASKLVLSRVGVTQDIDLSARCNQKHHK